MVPEKLEVEVSDDPQDLSVVRRSTGAPIAGRVQCWTPTDDTLVLIENLDDVVALTHGFAHTCALRSDGTVWCAGSVDALGTEAVDEDSAVFVQVEGIDDAVAIHSGGNSRTCALLQDQTIRCWGLADLGDGTGASSRLPVEARNFDRPVRVVVNSNGVCALLEDTTVWCSLAPVDRVGVSSADLLPAPVACCGLVTTK